MTALAFTPAENELISAGGGSLDVRSATDGAILRTLPCALPKITGVAFHPHQPILAVGGGTPGARGEILLMTWPAGNTHLRMTNHADLVTSVAFSIDGALLGVASADRLARLWKVSPDGAGLGESLTLSGHSGPVLALAFSPTSPTVVTASADRSLKVWSTEDGRLIRTLSSHTVTVHSVVFRPQMPSAPGALEICASAGDDRTVRIWQPAIGRMVRIVRYHEGSIFALAFSPDGQRLFSAGKEGQIRQIDAESDTIQAQWQAHRDWIYTLAVSPDGTKIASGDWSGTVRIRDL